MKLTELIKPLACNVINKGSDFSNVTIGNVTASDLMSDVLVVDKHDLLIVTSLASDQVIRTSDIIGVRAVVVVNGKALPATMVKLAQELDMTLLLSPLTKFMACVRIGRLLEVQ